MALRWNVISIINSQGYSFSPIQNVEIFILRCILWIAEFFYLELIVDQSFGSVQGIGKFYIWRRSKINNEIFFK